MDIGTGLAVFGAARLVEKLLGPTAAYIGEGLKDWTEVRVSNVRNIFSKAIRKLGDGIDEPGVVSPRALSVIVQEGQCVEDDLVSEYFAGVLASSRTESGRDDRGASMAKLVSRLSVYQLRGHYVFYSSMRAAYHGTPTNVGIPQDRSKRRAFIGMPEFFLSMDFSRSEPYDEILQDVAFGLERENLLLDAGWAYGEPAALKPLWKDAAMDGWIVGPSVLGVQLYMWAQGKGSTPLAEFWMGDDSDFPSLTEVHLPNHVVAVDAVG
jgi:hypothetical protein